MTTIKGGAQALVLVLMAGAMVAGCAPIGGSGGADGLPWVPCTEIEGEAPCCPMIDVEALCDGRFEAGRAFDEIDFRQCWVDGRYS